MPAFLRAINFKQHTRGRKINRLQIPTIIILFVWVTNIDGYPEKRHFLAYFATMCDDHVTKFFLRRFK